MTLVLMGKKNGKDCLMFEFEHAMDAFVFYSQAKDTYREDDLHIVMLEEEGDTDV